MIHDDVATTSSSHIENGTEEVSNECGPSASHGTKKEVSKCMSLVATEEVSNEFAPSRAQL